MNRTLAVTRMHLTDRLTLFVLPLAILAASFVVNVVIFTVEPVHARTTGGVGAIYFFVLVAAAMCTGRGLNFALSMGASRRAFAYGTAATGGVLAVAFGVLLLVLNRLEVLTDGWWLHGRFFNLSWYAHANPAVIWLLFTVALLALFLLGAWASTILLRWKAAGLAVGAVAVVLVFGAAAVLSTWQNAWGSIGHWFTQLSPLAASGWIALLCTPLAAASYATLRRVSV